MTEAGFFAPRQNSPGSLTVVILLHAALLAAVIMIKSPVFERITHPPITVRLINAQTDPPPDPPPTPQQRRVEQRAVIDRPPPIIDLGPARPPVVPPWQPPVGGTGDVVPPQPIHPDPPPLPVRRGAELDPRYADQLQPPYPAEMQRDQREGRVQVRVTIAPSGRVSAVARLMATNDAFWRVTEQQALSHWRFRPATVDGRPVEGSKVMTLIFRIENAV
ncbi:MAG TPA: TonB family protein [Allosphingosinicella sp.]|nr:TonB family protein [Allosphingosinicella sp.]